MRKNRNSGASGNGNLFAAIDLGTNNCRLLIARPLPNGGFRVVEAFSRIVRLGEGLNGSGSLSEAAIERTIDALQVCAEKIARRRVRKVRCVATAACRKAPNSDEFVDSVRERTGLELEIISPEEEARLALSGCTSLLQGHDGPSMVFDIGGGSTELAVAGPMGDSDLTVLELGTFPLGVVTFAEQFGGGEVSEAQFCHMSELARDTFREFEERVSLGRDAENGQLQLLGTSGTVTTLGGMYLDLARYSRAAVDGLYAPVDAFRRISADLRKMNLAERTEHPCIGRGRADLVIAGCAILEGLLDVWSAPNMIVADRGLREGILLNLMRNEHDRMNGRRNGGKPPCGV